MTTQTSQKNELFEARLLVHLLKTEVVKNDYDVLAAILSQKTGKNVTARNIFYMVKGESYAKKWLILALLELSLKSSWMPSSIADWENLIWTITGKKQPVQGGDNSGIFEKLAEMADKNCQYFEQNFELVVYGR
ncbi:hypothetical protein [Pseudoalteromonas luteoviolacea]|uniref:hypothetical protein n=1 Tax=Pseudoalteromonas luteoviolacea TaxID=43657 RepID=UPI001B374507|nr:hypothetical protein [Pseudoalteromonas luteoviolacea]MBQ4839810.1 hypothetical protein [Pseudoalteromonas luteoviolacea]